MPLFSRRFMRKAAPARQSSASNQNTDELEDLVFNQRSVALKLGDQNLIFENGQWIPENGNSGQTHKNTQRLKKQIQELQEENNLLKLKYTVMLNMLTENAAKFQAFGKEPTKIRK